MLSGVAKGSALPGRARTRKTGHHKDLQPEGRREAGVSCDPGKLHALQRDGMEAGAAAGWRGRYGGGGVRLRDGGACVAGHGARANSETLPALRFWELRHRPDGREDLDGAARAFAEASETVHARVCARVSGFVRK